MRRLISVKTILLFALFALVGCTSDIRVTQQITKSAQPGEKVAAPAAWEQRWEQVLTAARKEGKVVVYSSANPQTRTAIGNGFKDKFGIEVEYVTGIGAELVARYATEWRAGIRLADLIVIGAPDLLGQVKPLGALTPIGPNLILPEVTDVKSWRLDKVPFVDKEGQVMAFLAGYSTVIAVNTDLVKEGQVKSYADLLQPAWKGKILMSDPTVAGTAMEWVAFMLLNVTGMEPGKEFMAKLIKQELVIIRDTRLTVDWVSRGKYPLVIGPHRQAVTEFQAAGAPIKWIRLAEGGLLSPAGGCVSLPEQRPHPNATIAFLNWLLSREGQTIFYKNYGTPSARSDVPTEGLDPASVPVAGEKVFIPDEEWYAARTGVIPGISKQIFGPLLQ